MDETQQLRDDIRNLRKSKIILSKQLDFLKTLQQVFASKSTEDQQLVATTDKDLEVLLRDKDNPEVEENRKLQQEIHKWVCSDPVCGPVPQQI